MRKILLVLFAFVITACATPQQRMDKNNDGLLSLEMDMSKQDVMKIMGNPDLNEAYKSLHGKSVVIFFYYTQRKRNDGNVTKDETTPVVFENGRLVGWGSEFYETKRKVEMDINIKNK